VRNLGLYFSAALVLTSIGCASSEQQGQDDQLEASQQQGEQGAENQADANAEQGEGENFQAQQAENGEEVNNAEDEEFAQQNSGQEVEGQQLNNAALDTDEADQLTNNGSVNQATTGQSANEIPAEPLDPAAMPAAPAAAPSGNGMVKYAPGPVEVFDQPNGKMIGQFQTGDHPLVYEDNGWSRTADGRFVNQNALTNKGVGRPRDAGIWQ
jgi:hypothetical protein